MVAQIVLLRELLCLFQGNEFFIGLMLAMWLLATAAGSGILGVLTTAYQQSRLAAGVQLLAALSLPIAVVLIRSSRVVFPAVPGEVLGPGRMFLTSLLALGICASLSGIQFAVASRWWMQVGGVAVASATSSAYLLETLGAAGGGLLASIVLLPWFSSLHIALVLAAAQIVLAAWILFPSRRALPVSLLLLLVAAFAWPSVSDWDRRTLGLQWPGLRLVETANSRYGALAVVETDGGRSLAQSGVLLFTAGDTEAAEEAVHFALLQHPAPRTVLLVGGGVNGSARQVVQHPSVQRLDYVELDPRILEIAARRFPVEWAGLRDDPRIHVHPLDGRAFLRTTDLTFDVIILNLPEPRTAQWNRFYTREFFDQARAALSPGGILGFQLRAAENYLNPQRAAFYQCIQQTLRQSFVQVKVIPGDTLYFLASDRPGVLRTDAQLMEQRVNERRLRTTYVRDYFLNFRLSPERQADVAGLIAPSSTTPVNRDFTPVAYYLDTNAWSTHFGRAYSGFFERAAGVGFGSTALGLALATAIAAGLLALLPRSGGARVSSALCTGAMGMTMLALELFLLVGFQALYGYVFHQLALIIAGFMLGMAMGTWQAQRRLFVSTGATARGMILLQLGAALAPLLLWILLSAFGRIRGQLLTTLAAQLGFPALAVLCGLLGGLQFPLASWVFFRSPDSRSAGSLYAFDVLGSCLGAVACTLFLLPLVGLGRTALLLSVANLGVALVAATALGSEARNH